MRLRNLHLEREYRSLHSDIVRDFYEPVLTRSTEYMRAVGFFSSTALLGLTEGLRGFIKNGGANIARCFAASFG